MKRVTMMLVLILLGVQLTGCCPWWWGPEHGGRHGHGGGGHHFYDPDGGR